MRGPLKDMSKTCKMRYIDVNKISFGSTIWGPRGLRVAKKPSLFLCDFDVPILGENLFLLRATPCCLHDSPAALGLDWSGHISSLCFSLSFSLLFCLLAS